MRRPRRTRARRARRAQRPCGRRVRSVRAAPDRPPPHSLRWRWTSLPRRRALAPPTSIRNFGRMLRRVVVERGAVCTIGSEAAVVRDGGPRRARRGRELAAQGATHGVDVARALAGRHRQHPVDRREQGPLQPRECLVAAGREDRQEVVEGAHDRRRRRLTGQREVQRRTERVEIRPRALAHLAVVRILLHRRERRLQDCAQELRAVADDAPRGAEVEQHRPAVGQDQDVVGRDVAMEHALAVQELERVEQRLDERGSHSWSGGELIRQRTSLSVSPG